VVSGNSIILGDNMIDSIVLGLTFSNFISIVGLSYLLGRVYGKTNRLLNRIRVLEVWKYCQENPEKCKPGMIVPIK